MTETPFVVRGSSGRVEGWAARPLPFQPTGWLLDYRNAMRQVLAGLDPARGQTLVASYSSPDGRQCDIENLLLYNLGISAFSHLRLGEVTLTRGLRAPTPPEGDARTLVHHHRYELAPSGPSQAGAVLVHLGPVPLPRPLTVERLWYAVRSRNQLPLDPVVARRRLGLDLTVHRPASGAPPALLGMVKVLVDGVLSSLHVHDGTQLDVVSARLAARLGLSADEVARLLVANPTGVLGHRRLVWPFREFVQWNPADDGLVQLRVRAATSQQWQVSGALLDVDIGVNRASSV